MISYNIEAVLKHEINAQKTQGKVISAILILFFYYFSNIRIRFHYDAERITENIEIHEIMKTPAVYISSQLGKKLPTRKQYGKLRKVLLFGNDRYHISVIWPLSWVI